MRIDKYLKVSRLIKRREIAKQMCVLGYIEINGIVAKPSSEIKVGDKINISNPNGHRISFVVENIKDNCPASQASELYKLITEE